MRYLESFKSNEISSLYEDVINMIIDKIENESFMKYDTITSIIEQKKEYLEEVISFYNANMSNIEIKIVDTPFISNIKKHFIKYPIKYDYVEQNLSYLEFTSSGDINDDLDSIIKFKSFIKKKFSVINEGRNSLLIYLEPLEYIRYYRMYEKMIEINSIEYFHPGDSTSSLTWASSFISNLDKEVFSKCGKEKYNKLGISYSYDMNTISIRFKDIVGF